jgi:hypothetical protein
MRKNFVEKTLIPTFQREVAGLRALRPSTADQPAINTMLNNLDQGFAEFDKNAKVDVLTAFSKTPQALKDAVAEAKAYGFHQCGQ